jgi:transposase
MPFRAQPIVLDDETRAVLEARVRAAKTAQRDVARARVVLLAADGLPSRQISRVVGMHESHVAMWRQRFLAGGLAGLRDAPRPGGPRKYDPLDRLRIVAKATSARPADDPEAAWTYQALTDALADEVGISRSQLWRILNRLDIKPHKVTGWLHRRDDPDFWDRVRDVCGLYLDPPERALVLSVDEKTGIQAKERVAATTPAGSGRPARQEFEYRRHGTASLLAALEVHSGKVTAKDITRNNSVTFIGFLEDLDRDIPAELEVHLVLDNGSSHTSKATRAWLAEHPRFVAHYTPKHASWVNQVELFFSILTRKVLKRGSFSSRDDLVGKLMRYITAHNETAAPFKWTYTGEPLKAAS